MSLPAPFYQDEKVTLYRGDCRELLPELAADCIITDPPASDIAQSWDIPAAEWLGLARTPPAACVWIFGPLRCFLSLRLPAGWSHAQEIIWDKDAGAVSYSHRFRRTHELVAQFHRGRWSDVYKRDGDPRLQRSVLRYRPGRGRGIHATQKPVELLKPLIAYSCRPGGVVLDPFAGSCSALLAAQHCGMRAIGIEISAELCDRAARSLARPELAFSGEALECK